MNNEINTSPLNGTNADSIPLTIANFRSSLIPLVGDLYVVDSSLVSLTVQNTNYLDVDPLKSSIVK